jgi:Integrase core domain
VERDFRPTAPDRTWSADITYIGTWEGHRHSWPTRAEARTSVFEYIEEWFNPRRRHSTLDYLSPTEYGHQHETAACPGHRMSTITPQQHPRAPAPGYSSLRLRLREEYPVPHIHCTKSTRVHNTGGGP